MPVLHQKWGVYSFFILLLLTSNLSIPSSASSSTYEISFDMRSLRQYHIEGFELGIGAVYNITVKIDDLEGYHIFSCSFTNPPNYTFNGISNFAKSEKIFFTQDSSVHSILKSNNLTHLVPASVSIYYESNNFPESGISGTITVDVLKKGLEDNSFYYSFFRLNSSFPLFEFDIFDQLWYDSFNNAILRFQIISKNHSQSAITVGIWSNTGNLSYWTDFHPYKVAPGNISIYDFSFDNDMTDATVPFLFNIALVENKSMEGEITCFLLKVSPRDVSGFDLFPIFLAVIALVNVYLRRSHRK